MKAIFELRKLATNIGIHNDALIVRRKYKTLTYKQIAAFFKDKFAPNEKEAKRIITYLEQYLENTKWRLRQNAESVEEKQTCQPTETS